jgi:hypothetical protein
VHRGDLAATVVMPATTPTAIHMLARYWDRAEHREPALLEPESYPALDKLAPLS